MFAGDALAVLVNFASTVMTNVGPGDLLTRVATLKAGRARREASETEKAAMQFAAHPTYSGASALLASISREAGVSTHRPPVLRGCVTGRSNCRRPRAALRSMTLPFSYGNKPG